MKVDVLIIGGGAIGSAVGYFLKMSQPSCRVAIVERDPTYALASTPRASGGVRRLFSTCRKNIALSNFSIPFFQSFSGTMAVDGEPAEIGFKKGGYLFIVPPSSCDMLKRNFHDALKQQLER